MYLRQNKTNMMSGPFYTYCTMYSLYSIKGALLCFSFWLRVLD